jgi:hypothetical protein
MITSCLALFATRLPQRAMVVEYREPRATEISIQIMARIPRLTARQEDSLEALRDCLLHRPDGYGPKDIFDVTNGDTIRSQIGPDYIRLSFHVPSNGLHGGLSLAEALVQQNGNLWDTQPVTTAINPWRFAIRPLVRTRVPKPYQVQDLYRTLFRPENICLAIGGPIVPGEATQIWRSKMAAWSPPPVLPPSKYEPLPIPSSKNLGGLDSVEIRGPAFAADDPMISSRILAVIALGTGKGSSAFRVARQKLAFSYRQEGFLYPETNGWRCRLIFIRKPATGLQEAGAKLQKEIAEDVSQWTERDRIRALGMTDAFLNRGVGPSPFAFGVDGAVDNGLEGRTFLNAYWKMKTGTTWNAENLRLSLENVSLESLKRAASEIVNSGSVQILPGR